MRRPEAAGRRSCSGGRVVDPQETRRGNGAVASSPTSEEVVELWASTAGSSHTTFSPKNNSGAPKPPPALVNWSRCRFGYARESDRRHGRSSPASTTAGICGRPSTVPRRRGEGDRRRRRLDGAAAGAAAGGRADPAGEPGRGTRRETRGWRASRPRTSSSSMRTTGSPGALSRSSALRSRPIRSSGFAYGRMRFFGDWEGELALPAVRPLRASLPAHDRAERARAAGGVRRDGGLRPELPQLEDWELWVHALAQGWRGRQVDAVTVEYRRHEARSTARPARVPPGVPPAAGEARGALPRPGPPGPESSLGPPGAVRAPLVLGAETGAGILELGVHRCAGAKGRRTER